MGHLRSPEVRTSFDRLERSTWPSPAGERVEHVTKGRLSHMHPFKISLTAAKLLCFAN